MRYTRNSGQTQGGTEAKAFVYKRLMESIRRQQKEQDKPIFPSSGFEFRVRLKHIHLKLEEKDGSDDEKKDTEN